MLLPLYHVVQISIGMKRNKQNRTHIARNQEPRRYRLGKTKLEGKKKFDNNLHMFWDVNWIDCCSTILASQMFFWVTPNWSTCPCCYFFPCPFQAYYHRSFALPKHLPCWWFQFFVFFTHPPFLTTHPSSSIKSLKL